MRQVLQKLDSLGGSYASKKYWANCYVPVKSKLQHPPGQPPGHLNFWKNFVQIPPSPGRKGVQMPPPPGKLPDYFFTDFSVAFLMLLKLCM